SILGTPRATILTTTWHPGNGPAFLRRFLWNFSKPRISCNVYFTISIVYDTLCAMCLTILFDLLRSHEMSAVQKQAWFGLTIVVLSLAGILALSPVLGFQRAQGSLGLLGLWGFTPLLYRPRAGVVSTDERDGLIQVRSWVIAYSLFWVVFVLVCIAAPLSYGSS